MINFSESQKFRQWWLWVILVVSIASATSLICYAKVQNKDDMPAFAVVAGVLVPLLIIALFLFANLQTAIDDIGVSVRFPPFRFKSKVIPWDEIANAWVRKYNPIGEFGGWGARYTFSRGTAYNVSGNMGLQLVLKDGKKMLIGSQQPDELAAVLQRLNKVPGDPASSK